jgi:adenosylcobinamide kinase/adenosylcobinamide-phosphate guanylyltransferase
LRIFITGGCKNGKSTRAERLAIQLRQPGRPLYYVATMASSGLEDDARISRHQKSRKGLGFQTIEAKRDIHTIADGIDPLGSVLLDSVTALYLNEMLTPEFDVDPASTAKVARDLTSLLDRLEDIVLVSDYIYSDAGFFSDLTVFYRQGLATLDRLLASRCDVVIEACFGNFIIHKGLHLIEALDREGDQQ